MYSIKQLEKLTNIKAHTIRIWEQRYNLITPERSSTNIRLYSDDDLKRLLNVCTLMEMGMKISQISKLDGSQISEQIEKLIALSVKSNNSDEVIINQLLSTVSDYDVVLFNTIFNRSVKNLGLIDTYSKVLKPVLTRIGLLWRKDDSIPAQEHFLSNQLKQKFFAAIDDLPKPSNPDQTWLLFLHENEKHEIGLLFAHYLLRKQGKKVVYLGQEVPYSNIKNCIKQINPSHIYTFFTIRLPQLTLSNLLIKLQSDFRKVKICVSGNTEIIGTVSLMPTIKWIQSSAELLEYIRSYGS